MPLYLSIKIHGRFTQLDSLSRGPDTNSPLQVDQRYSFNPHDMFWTFFKIGSDFEE